MDKIVEILNKHLAEHVGEEMLKGIAAEIRAEIEKEYKEKGFTTATFSEKDGLVFNKD